MEATIVEIASKRRGDVADSARKASEKSQYSLFQALAVAEAHAGKVSRIRTSVNQFTGGVNVVLVF